MTSNSECPVINSLNRIPVMRNYNLDPRHILYLHHSDNPNCSLTNELLNGNNYAQWRRSFEVSLSAKNKLSFVNGDYTKPASNFPLLPLWERCNSMVISWLLHSLSKDTASSIIILLRLHKFGKICHKDSASAKVLRFTNYRKS